MAELVVSNPLVVEVELQESPRLDVDHETGAPWQGYSSGYATGSETRSPRRRHRIRRGSASRGSSQHSNAAAVWPSQAESSPGRSGRSEAQHRPPTEPLPRRLPKPLLTTLKRLRNLDPATWRQLTDADELLSQARHAEAIPYLETGLMGANRHPELQSLVWMLLGNCQTAVGDYKRASVCHMHHLAFCRELQDFAGMTRAECNLGIAYMKLGLLKLAGRCFLQYLENSQLLQDEPNIASAYSNLGMLSRVLAVRSFQSAVKEETEGGRAQGAQEVLKTHMSRAITYFEHHLEIVEQQGNMEKQGRVYGCLGTCYEMLRQFPQAIFCHNKRLEMARRVGNRRSECCALCNLGNCFRASGKLQEAMEYYLLNLELTRAINDISGEMVSLLNLGTTCELLNCLDKAIEWHTLYLGMTVKTRDLKGQARAFSTLAGLYEESRQLVKAHELYWNLVKVFQQLGDRDAHSAASAYLEQVKAAMEREKLRQQKLRKHSKSKRTPHTVSKASGFRETRSKASQNRMGSWSYSQGSGIQQLQHQNLYSHRESPPSSHGYRHHRGSHNRQASITSSLVFQNPSVYDRECSRLSSSQEFLTLATQPQRVYRSQPVSQSLLEHETSLEVHPGGRHYPEEELRPFYYLGDVMNEQRGTSASPEDRPLPDLPDEDFSEEDIQLASESITDYESVTGDHHPHSTSQVLGSLRHRRELQRMSQDFTQPVSELDLEGTDKEWEQWLHIRRTTDFEDNPLSKVGSMNVSSVQRSRTMPVGGVGKANFSAPELDRFELGRSDDDDSLSSGTLTPQN